MWRYKYSAVPEKHVNVLNHLQRLFPDKSFAVLRQVQSAENGEIQFSICAEVATEVAARSKFSIIE